MNINTASPEVLEVLFTNLQIRDRNSRVTAQEAQQLADVIVASRPFAGFEDFLKRIVLPAGFGPSLAQCNRLMTHRRGPNTRNDKGRPDGRPLRPRAVAGQSHGKSVAVIGLRPDVTLRGRRHEYHPIRTSRKR